MQQKHPGEDEPQKQTDESFFVVGIGASAGGIEAMSEFLLQLSPDTGMAYIYIQHLDRNYESNLAEILSRSTQMKVLTAKNLTPLKPNHVYIMPPDKEVAVVDGLLKLTKRPPKSTLNLPINFLFMAMAENVKERAIGIVLSGMASDGALGLKAIKQAGGITFAQDESAKFESMPKSAIAAGGVDAVLPPVEMARELERIGKNLHLLEGELVEPMVEENEEEGTGTDEVGSTEEKKDNEVRGILDILLNAYGIDFKQYKKNTIRRRIVRRMLLGKFNSLADYVQFLKRNPDESQNLYNDLLINVTHFFRDPDATEYLKKNILPRLLKTKNVNEPLRIWVPACSTGEEAYSLAMIVYEAFAKDAAALPVQIFATDLSENALAKARAGVYSLNDVQMVPPEMLARFFTKVDGHYRIVKVIRDTCVFAPHNIFKDPPFSRVDIISCCNVLIYLDSTLQRKVMANFHYSLNKGGYLVLGQSETVGTSAQLFSKVDRKVKIFTKKNDVVSKAMFEMNYTVSPEAPAVRKSSRKAVADFSKNMNLEKMVDRIFLSDLSPAAVVVNEDLEILQFRGSTSLYLEPSPGQASLNLLKMARSGLAFELKNAANKSFRSNEQVNKTGVEIHHKGVFYHVSFTISPLNLNADERLLLIVFEEVKLPSVPEKKGQYSRDRRIKQLENELLSLREDMRSIIEEQEAANEELQSANEEIVSSNEELQSMNEELETSKEEIESSNEELITINQELLTRNDQLAEAIDYTAAVVATIRESVLILDNNLIVKVANASFYRTFNTIEKYTEGILLYDLGHGDWKIPILKKMLEGLVPGNSSFYGLEIKQTFKNVGEKVFLVNGKKVIQSLSQQQLYLLAFEDITEHKQAERLLEEREAWLRNMADNVPVMIWVATPDKNFTFLNKTWLAFTGRTLAKETGIGWTEGIHKEDIKHCLTTYHSAFDSKTPFRIEYRMKRYDGEYRWILNSAVPSYDSENSFTGYIGSVTEIHDKRMLNEELEQIVQERTRELKEVNSSLERSNSELQQFAYVASHDLQEPLRKIITFSNRLREKYEDLLPEDSKEYIDKIKVASKRMTDLIDGLLDFSRATKPGKNIVDTDLNQVLQNVSTDLELVVQEQNATIVAENLPVVEAMPLHMNQLFYNLLGNALKFTPKGVPPVIHITCHALEPHEVESYARFNKAIRYYEIVFKDEGIGFPQEFSEQIFVIFQRLNERHNYSGTGIGLALCRRIVENHGGVIFAMSQENEGSEFHIILPEKQSK
jgi:two-component system CheB/CheR fusion protein